MSQEEVFKRITLFEYVRDIPYSQNFEDFI